MAEYRSSQAETINYRQKETGAAAKFNKVTHNIELGSRSVPVSERLEDTVDVTKYQAPFKKGTMVILHLESFGREKGQFFASGKLEAITD